MPAVCVCDCGLDVDQAGALCLDWETVGMHRQCATTFPYSSNLPGVTSSDEWFQLRDVFDSWTNSTCRTHRVIVRASLPYVLFKQGENNSWQVRLFLDGAVGGPPSFDGERDPELYWSAVWSGGLPAGTDGEQRTPGSAKREFLVPPGQQLVVAARVQVRTPVFTVRPANQLAFGTLKVSLSAWPSTTDTGTGRTC